LEQAIHFSSALSDTDREELFRAFDTQQTDPSPQQRGT
jgi:hypothetical protein